MENSCTDCDHGAYFGDELIIVCMHRNLPAAATRSYLPVTEVDAKSCPYFAESFAIDLTEVDLCDALAHDADMDLIEDMYEFLRVWVEEHYPELLGFGD